MWVWQACDDVALARNQCCRAGATLDGLCNLCTIYAYPFPAPQLALLVWGGTAGMYTAGTIFSALFIL